jgi:hypothetical protein
MNHSRLALFLSVANILLCVGSGIAAVEKSPNQKPLQFNRDVQPILSNVCYACHGPDPASREAGLRLDQRAAAIAKLDSGARAIVPGNIEASEMVRRMLTDDKDERMPPPTSNKKLTVAEIDTLKRWIAQGAEYLPHWAFMPPKHSNPPVVNDLKKWVRNDIDRFVLARLEREGLQPAGEATRESLLRRLAFDLTGLPPTVEDVKSFLADTSPQAYEKMVDRYLASPTYGEQMARHWLDLARYADTNGYQYDTERQQWVWRDWVIDAYNRNMPFDQFTIEQLAGDLLPNATPQQHLATGFNRNHGVTIEGGVVDEEYRVEYVMDRLVTTGTTWLGLTVGCARCHDHKFDPLSQKEFYHLYAFFNQVQEKGLNGFEPKEVIASPLAVAQNQQLADEIARLERQLTSPSEADPKSFDAWVKNIAASRSGSWNVLVPQSMTSSGGSTLTKLDDNSILAGDANPTQDIYEFKVTVAGGPWTAVRLEALTHDSLPGGGPGRHTNSNFMLSEFELVTAPAKDHAQSQAVKLARAEADYSQKDYQVAKAIDGVEGNSGGAVDGPTRKQPATAMFVAAAPFGNSEETVLTFRLKHTANFGAHGIGRAQLAVTNAPADLVSLQGPDEAIMASAKKPPAQRSAAETAGLRKLYDEQAATNRKSITERNAQLHREQEKAYPATMIMRDLPKPRPTYILNRGQYDEPKEQVAPNVPAIFPPLPPGQSANRLALARWLVDQQHPLMARVTVNRYWQRLFGVGLVKTAEDFGLQSESPSHPELLDWLATEFRHKWDNKNLLKTIVMSATYRQSSHVGRVAFERDPENRLLSRGPRMRLDAEEVRDAALAVSGQLVTKLGGKSVYPYQPPGLRMELNNRPGYSTEYVEGKGDDLYRRSIYTFWKRTVPSPMLKTLDAPDREICTVRRSRTNTPLQSLLLLNGPQFIEAARHLGARMMTREAISEDDRIAYGFALSISRRPTAEELALLRELLDKERARFRSDKAAAEALLKVGASSRDEKLDAVEHAAWTSVGRLLLNLDEFVTKG